MLQYTAQAMHRTEQAAFGDVLADSVTPALRRVGVRWDGSGAVRQGGATQDDPPLQEEREL